MAKKPPFKLALAETLDHFVIRLECDSMTNIAREIGEAPERVEAIPIFYDEGNDEFAPIEGYIHDTARGRLSMHVINTIYGEVLGLIHEHRFRLAA